MYFLPYAFARQSIDSLCQAAKQFLRQWTKPDNHGLALNTAMDLTRSKPELLLENLLLRQQLVVLNRQVKRPAPTWRDRGLTVLLASKLPTWKQALVIVQPETVLRCHRELFRGVRRHKLRRKRKRGRPPLTDDIVALIKQMACHLPTAEENRTWGAERIRGELVKLGLRINKSTIQKYIQEGRGPRAPKQTWANFLRNHAQGIWACDFLQTYDVFFRTVFVFLIIELGSRRLVHFGVTRNPTDLRVAQQLREATLFGDGPRYLVRDNDSKYGASFTRVAVGTRIEVLLTPYGAPKANAACERFLGSVRRECLDFFLILSERHLHRVMKQYQVYFNHARPHHGIGHSIPCQRGLRDGSAPSGTVVSRPVLGGLHHDYHWQPPSRESPPKAA